MRLKQIKLIGFKSFVDPTVLHLNSQLIGIVGPNGCGKSNIIDAVRWLLGESSAKDLRGESMLDVIFNGSSSRKLVGYAAVELLFDNSDGKLNREYANFAEVSIRRDLDRDRQSEYYLNNKKCRKRDITDLFAGTGLLQNGYAIISQGTVSKIIESKPEDLRAFVEEAAELSIYKKRRHETQLRMAHAEENINRLKDTIFEQSRIVEKLTKQSATAEKYQQYKAEKREIEIKVLAIKSYQFKKNLQHYDNQIQQLSIELEKHFSDRAKITAKLEQQKLLQNDKHEEFSDIQKKYYELGASIAKVEQTLKHKQEKQAKIKEDLTTVNLELEKILQQHIADQKLQETLLKDLSFINQQYEELVIKKADLEKNYSNAQTNMHNWHNAFNAIQLKLQEVNSQAENNKLSLDQIERQYKEWNIKIDRLVQENNSYDQANLAKEILQLEGTLSIEEELRANNAKKLLEIIEFAKQEKIYIKNLLDQKNKLQAEIHKLVGVIGSIQEFQQSALAINPDKSSWLVKNNILSDSLLFDQLNIDHDWEIAVGTVLNQYLDAILLANNVEFNSINNWQSINNFRLALIEQSSNKVLEHQQAENINNNQYTSILSKITNNFAIKNLFKNIYVADNIEFALEHRKNLYPNQCFVTKNGELVGFNWLIIDKVDLKQQILLKNKELKNFKNQLQVLESELINLNTQLETRENSLLDVEKQQVMLMNSSKEEERKIRNIVAELSAKNSKLENIKQRAEKISIEIAEYRASLQDLSTKEISLRGNIAVVIEKITELGSEQQLLLNKKQALKQALEQFSQQNKIINQEFHAISLQKQSLTTKIQALDEAKQRSGKQVQILEEKKAKLSLELQTNNDPLQPIEQELNLLLEDRLEQEEIINQSKENLADLDRDIKQLEQQYNGFNNIIEQNRSNSEQLKLDQNSVVTRLATLMETAKENNYLEQINNLNLLEQDLNIDVWQKRLDLINQSIEKLGAVNLSAIEEFKIETERKQYLDLQLEDLTIALTTLQEAIFKIDSETRKKFKATFEQINDYFQKLFPTLFGGGGAYLALDTDDWLSAGVSLMARPPGKKNSTIHLLSGGEKALTAIALIFAIFKLNPAPFCILDEVDAPLDDANVTRFTELLTSMSEQVQFIFITHNKTTMKIANQLIGVTMKEPGVSRLVSVNVDEAVEMVS